MIPVVFVISQAGKQADGGVRSISLIVDRLRSRGRVAPIIVTNAETPRTAGWRSTGHEVHVWPVAPPAAATGLARLRERSRRFRGILGGSARIVRLLRGRGARVVHCNDHPALWMAAPGARAAGARVVTNIRDTLGVKGPKWKMSRMLSDRVVVLSDEMKEYVERMLAPPSPAVARFFASVERIYSVVDFEAMRPPTDEERAALRARLGLGERTVAVAVVAAFVPKKQQLELLRHLAGNPAALPPEVTLAFVGDFAPEADGYARACRDAVKQRAHDLRFVGYTAAVADWYRAVDLTLVPSREEGLARCMIESLACSTPVVSFDVCSAREVLEGGGCGVVVRQGDFGGLCAAVASLASDGEARQKLGAAGARFARERFAAEAVVEAYEHLYQALHDA